MISDNDKVEISVKDLKELISECGNITCGQILKRIDILDDKESLKTCVKELVYEGYRNLKHMLKAYEKGAKVTHFKFKSPKE